MKIRQIFAQTAIGAIVGAGLMVALQGRDLDHLSLQNAALKMEIETLTQENMHLTAILNQPQKERVIQSIRIEADAPDKMTELKAIQFVKERLSYLIGDRVDQVSPETPFSVIDGRILGVDTDEFRLRVMLVFINDTLYMKVRLIPLKAS